MSKITLAALATLAVVSFAEAPKKAEAVKVDTAKKAVVVDTAKKVVVADTAKKAAVDTAKKAVVDTAKKAEAKKPEAKKK